METLSLLLGTVQLRPYVFVFLAIYLTIAILHMGLLRSLILTVLAFSIAFLAAYSSTHNGFPYGFYSYIETTRDRELWIANIPFMDPLSFSFLTYTSYTMGLLLWSPLKKNGWDIRIVEQDSIKSSPRVIVTGAALFMLMDVVVDPVALQGNRWFLGKIYFYWEEGEYFNIPLTNFGGWFLVGSVILYSFTRLNRWLDRIHPVSSRPVPGLALLGPGLYFSVLVFNLAVTFYIGEIGLGICSSMLTLAILAVVLYKIRRPECIRI